MKLSSQQKGFTLIELLVAIAIIGVLAALSYPSYLSYIRRARLDNARAMMSDTALAMERYYGQHQTFCQASGATGCTPPTVTFVTKNNASTTPTTGIVVTVDNDNYNFSIVKADTNNYVLKGAPKADLYSADDLATNQLILFYDSSVPAFVRCTSSGANSYLTISPTNPNGPDGCEVMQ